MAKIQTTSQMYGQYSDIYMCMMMILIKLASNVHIISGMLLIDFHMHKISVHVCLHVTVTVDSLLI